MELENHLKDPGFISKQRNFFQDFTLRHFPQMKELKSHGLFDSAPDNDWRGIVRHSLIGAAVVETLCILLKTEEHHTNYLVKTYLLHDKEKREQLDTMQMPQIIEDENKKKGVLRATGNNFTDFESWGTDEYIFRFADSSASTKLTRWRERIADFKTQKKEENEKGKSWYQGTGTWDKLEEIMGIIENDLYQKIVSKNTSLTDEYPDKTNLSELIEDKLIQRILCTI